MKAEVHIPERPQADREWGTEGARRQGGCRISDLDASERSAAARVTNPVTSHFDAVAELVQASVCKTEDVGSIPTGVLSGCSPTWKRRQTKDLDVGGSNPLTRIWVSSSTRQSGRLLV